MKDLVKKLLKRYCLGRAFITKPLLLLQFTFLLPCISFAQNTSRPVIGNGTIKGFIVDSANKYPLSNVSISVYEAPNMPAGTSIISNDDGSFNFTGLPYKRYLVVFTHIGYRTKTISLPFFTSSIIYVGKITLVPLATTLQEVVVIAKKSLIEQTLNKIIYNVAADPDSKSLNAFEILRKVPMISVDIDDKLKLNGSSSFRVFINNRPSSLFVRNANDVFKTMPASFINKIEVITSPPARYEAEGVTGIINIITNKKKINGYNGSLSLNADHPTGYNLGGFLTAKTGKLGFVLNAGNAQTDNPTSFADFVREDKRQHLKLQQSGESNSNNGSFYINTELSLEMDSLNLLTAALSKNTGKGSSDFSQTVGLQNAAGVLSQAYINKNNSITSWQGKQLGVDFQHIFKNNKERLLTLSYKISNNDNAGNINILLVPVLNYSRQKSYTFNSSNFDERTMQADYVQPIRGQMLETGFKSIVRNSNSAYAYENFDSITGNFIPDARLGNNFDYRQHINSAYLSFSFKKDKWGITAGGRLEETKVDANFKSSGTVVSQQYANLIPNIALMVKLKSITSLNLSYSQRIERPSLYYLDPYADISDPRNIYFGNPALLPALTNSFNLSYFTFINSLSVGTAVFHHFTNNAIERYTTVGADTIARTTYGNIGSSKTYGFSVSTNATFFNKLSVNVNSSGNYIKYSSLIKDLPQTNEGFSYELFGYSSFRFNKGWRASGSINYNSSAILLQGRKSGFISNNLSLTREFLKDKKANASFTVSNPFQKNRSFFNDVSDPTFYQLQQSRFLIRRFSLSLQYRFGKLKEDIARKKRGIKNDDLKN